MCGIERIVFWKIFKPCPCMECLLNIYRFERGNAKVHLPHNVVVLIHRKRKTTDITGKSQFYSGVFYFASSTMRFLYAKILRVEDLFLGVIRLISLFVTLLEFRQSQLFTCFCVWQVAILLIHNRKIIPLAASYRLLVHNEMIRNWYSRSEIYIIMIFCPP